MSLAATLAAEEIAERMGCSRTKALAELLSSDIGEAIYDDSLKLWWESPRALADAYLANRSKPKTD